MPMRDVACHECGAPNPADYTFCWHCRALPKAPETVPAAAETSPALPVNGAPKD